MTTQSTDRSPFSPDERGEIRGFFIGLGHWRWLWKRSKIWMKWAGAVGVSATAAVHWAQDFVPSVLALLRLLHLGQP